ncbi:ferredoxin [Saccharopolyspora sp. NPDC049426]|uniref:ferredoxin n=1 Tax=Saccharopolyspora sp. NPDC049426 TaxID=3155652 RepID=UPI00341A74FE
MAFVIGEPCIDVMDRSCIEECPVDCIYEGGRMLYIHPDECIDCAACEPVCPVEAIRPAQRVNEDWRPFQETSREAFAEIGSPGGSPNVTQPIKDPAFVAQYEKP